MRLKDFITVSDDYPKQPSANFALRAVRPVLRWAVDREYAPGHLAGKITVATTEPRNRKLMGDELGRVLVAIRSAKRMNAYARAMEMMLWTLSRREEVAETPWFELNFDTGVWTLPAPYTHPITGKYIKRTKNGLEHTIILPRQAVAMLRAMKPKDASPWDWVYPASRTRDGKPLNYITNWSKYQELINAASVSKGWHRHDLRRTGATMLAATGSPPHIIKAALNHVSVVSRLEATYNHYRYGKDVGDALQGLADWFDSIANQSVRVAERAASSQAAD
jgi:integrase